jgi:hypothetical protein
VKSVVSAIQSRIEAAEKSDEALARWLSFCLHVGLLSPRVACTFQPVAARCFSNLYQRCRSALRVPAVVAIVTGHHEAQTVPISLRCSTSIHQAQAKQGAQFATKIISDFVERLRGAGVPEEVVERFVAQALQFIARHLFNVLIQHGASCGRGIDLKLVLTHFAVRSLPISLSPPLEYLHL